MVEFFPFQKVLLRMFLILLLSFVIWRISHLSFQKRLVVSNIISLAKQQISNTTINNESKVGTASKASTVESNSVFQSSRSVSKFGLDTNSSRLSLNILKGSHHNQRHSMNSTNKSIKRKSSNIFRPANPYLPHENQVYKVATSWEDFVNLPFTPSFRNRQTIPNTLLSTLLACPLVSTISSNSSTSVTNNNICNQVGYLHLCNFSIINIILGFWRFVSFQLEETAS